MPNGRRESYEAVPRRPEQQGTEEPALSMSPVFSVHLLPCLNHTLSLSQTYPAPVSDLCYSQNLFICYPVFLIPCPISALCYSSNLFICYFVFLIPCPISALCYTSNLFICYLVFLIPYSCLKHTLSPYPPYPVPLSTLPCPYPVTKKVKPYSFTFFFFPLLSLLMRSRAVTTKTYFVCPP